MNVSDARVHPVRTFVTDNQQWQAPEATQPPPAFVPAGMGPSQAPPSAYAAPTPGAAPGWTPPPKPGLIPLRPMTFGTILGASFQVLRRNPGPVLGPAIAASLVYVLLTSLIVAGMLAWLFGRLETAASSDYTSILFGGYALTGLTLIAPLLLMSIATAVLQGVVVSEVARGTLGEKLRLKGLWRAVRPRAGALIGWALLVALVVTLALAIFVALLVGLASLGSVGIGFAVFLGIIGALAATAGSFFFMTKLAFVPSAIVLERLPIRRAVARSWSLTKGNFWRVLGIQLLVSVMLNVASQLSAIPAQVLAPLVAGLIAPNGGDTTATIVLVAVIGIVTVVLLAIVTGIGLVVQAATAALLYLDLRMRKEGLDLELTRFVEARQAGRADLPDPYLEAGEPIVRPAAPMPGYAPGYGYPPAQGAPAAPPRFASTQPPPPTTAPVDPTRPR